MAKRKIFRGQQFKFMIYNLIAFTIIFSIFSVIIFSQVQTTLFSKVDEELSMFKERSQNNNNDREFDEMMPNDGPDMGPPPEKRFRENPNPRMIVVKWNENGEITNRNEIGTLMYENYLQDYQLPISELETIAATSINDLYEFRSLLIEDTNTTDDIAYIQVMINVDAEQMILNSFGQLILICATIFILLSISASYILSKKMMQPIIASWNKQTEFVENVSHELRTPLTIIQNKLELLLTTPQEKIVNKFENIALSLSETRRLTKMTSDLLTLTRTDSADTALEKHLIKIDSFVEKVCKPYIEIAESQGKQFWLKLDYKGTLNADETRLHQLLVILLDNALKYTHVHDSIGISTYENDHKMILEVSDTGMGIKKESVQHIFDRFYREDKARSRDTGGTGLGLSIAKWIIEKHNGTIKVMQNETKGTTFIIKLPK